MQLAASTALFIAAVGSASATFLPASKDACSILQRADLINLDKLGCAKVGVDVLSKLKPVSKNETCKALQDGGLVNLSAFGCAQVEASVLADGSQSSGSKDGTCSAKKICSVIQKGALNADAFGCFNFDFDFFHLGGLHFDGGNSKRKAPHHPHHNPTPGTPGKPTSCNAQTCEVLQKGGLANLNLVGCGKASAHAGP